MRSHDRLDSVSGEIQISVQWAIIISSQSSDLAKLNPICHMNYSIIFTEISFYPETSIFPHYVTILIKFPFYNGFVKNKIVSDGYD